MRLKNLLYTSLVLIAVLVIMGVEGYTHLRLVLYDQMQDELRNRADFLAVQLNNPQNAARTQDIINDFWMSDDGYAWIVDRDGNIKNYPQRTLDLNPHYNNRDKEQANVRVSGESRLQEAGTGVEHRLLYALPLESTDTLVISRSLFRIDQALTTYQMYTFYIAFAVFIGALIAGMVTTRIVTKPIYDLQDYAKSMLVGEYIERAESLKDADAVVIASVLERLYNLSRGEKFEDENPLSGLPGNKSLYDTLFQRIDSQKPLAVGFIDANSFSAFKSKYGVDRANSVVRFMGVIILNAVTEQGTPFDKVYHLGNDRFFFITSPANARMICEKIIRDFDNQIVYFYDEEAREKGGIISTDKMGVTSEFPYMPICIGVATNTQRPLVHPVQVGHIVGEIRTYLRARRKSSYLIDRRAQEREIEYTGTMAPFSKEEVERVKKEIEELEEKRRVAREEELAKTEGESAAVVTDITGKPMEQRKTDVSEKYPSREPGRPETGLITSDVVELQKVELPKVDLNASLAAISGAQSQEPVEIKTEPVVIEKSTQEHVGIPSGETTAEGKPDHAVSAENPQDRNAGPGTDSQPVLTKDAPEKPDERI